MILDINWSDQDVARFVADQINYYGMDNVTPAESKFGISRWKKWLWLERHGFDFAYTSLEREIFDFRIKLEPSSVSLASERRLLLAIRCIMRDILLLPPLADEVQEQFLSTVPIRNWTHWAYSRPYDGSDIMLDPNADYSYLIDFAWECLKSDRPDYMKILREIKYADENEPQRFVDRYTFNGEYEFLLSGAQKESLYGAIYPYYVTLAYDALRAPGNLRLYHFIFSLFRKTLEDRIG